MLSGKALKYVVSSKGDLVCQHRNITGADRHDSIMFERLIDQLPCSRTARTTWKAERE